MSYKVIVYTDELSSAVAMQCMMEDFNAAKALADKEARKRMTRVTVRAADNRSEWPDYEADYLCGRCAAFAHGDYVGKF